MPKLKSNRGAVKRFSVKKGGKVRRRAANRNHILTKKSPKRKRHLRVAAEYLSKSDARLAKRLVRGS